MTGNNKNGLFVLLSNFVGESFVYEILKLFAPMKFKYFGSFGIQIGDIFSINLYKLLSLRVMLSKVKGFDTDTNNYS